VFTLEIDPAAGTLDIVTGTGKNPGLPPGWPAPVGHAADEDREADLEPEGAETDAGVNRTVGAYDSASRRIRISDALPKHSGTQAGTPYRLVAAHGSDEVFFFLDLGLGFFFLGPLYCPVPFWPVSLAIPNPWSDFDFLN